MDKCQKQALKCGTEILQEEVLSVDLGQAPFVISGSKTTMKARCLILATGARAKKLEIPGVEAFWQKGVSACAICDGALPLFRSQELFVVGGGDSAMEEALFLTKFASLVYIVHRREAFSASAVLAKRVLSHPKIKVLWNSELIGISGSKMVQQVAIRDLVSKTTLEKAASGVFFAIGHQPNTGFLNGQLKLNPAGYILTEKGTSTSRAGVFAAGDVQDPVYRQAISAAGSGCMAAIDAERWLSAKGFSNQ
ncbi:MAG: FAD-dependent oxidoreductase [Parachlamydiales bacterium]|jgi:thioredoxin reductase (NADPH)